MASQAVGIVLRDFGDSKEAIRELRSALRLARRAGSRTREADVLATLGIALVLGGRTTAARAVFDEAIAAAEKAETGRILMRRGAGMLIIGEHGSALQDLNRAVRVLRAGGDALWEPRALTARAFTHLAMGDTDRARADMLRAEQLLQAGGQLLELARARQNRGVLAFREGDLPLALALLDDAGDRFAGLGIVDPELSLDRCNVLLAAGLPDEGLDIADSALANLEKIGGLHARHAELLLAAATAALAANRLDVAGPRARQARQLFSAQRREWWRARAQLVELRARAIGGEVSSALLREASRCAELLDRLASPETAMARVLVGRLELAMGRSGPARRNLALAARARHGGSAQDVGWLAEALHAESAGEARRLLHACRRGLLVVEAQRDALGSSELRAQVTQHGSALAAVALRHVLRHGSPRQLLEWSERWRAGALAAPAVRPTADPAMRADLSALREITSRLRDPRAGTPALRREQARLERSIRSRAWRAAGRSRGSSPTLDLAALFDELETGRLVQLVDVEGQLHALVGNSGQVRRHVIGPTAAAAREVELARFALRRMLRRPGPAAFAQLVACAEPLSAALLGDARQHLGDGHVVVVPPSRLHAVPWALLPQLRDRMVSVAPSARVWLRARTAPPALSPRVTLVHGPELAAADSEIAVLARGYPDATVLGGGTATARRVLAALDGSDLAHIAAHGTFRASSPLFSSFLLDDGPLTVHDLEQLRHAPRRIVLSSCDGALLAPAGTDELLGLSSSMVPLGTAGMIAGVVPVDDVATERLMTDLHHHLRLGHSLADALCRARACTSDDPVSAATGWSFISLGAG